MAKQPVKISPSVLTADFWNLGRSIAQLEEAGADLLHLDVMDGLFVPNISFGLPVIAALKKHTAIPFDVHLMIEKPHRYLERFRDAGADLLGFHLEAGSPVEETLRSIRALGMKSCLTIKPATPAQGVFPYLPFCDMVLVMSVEPGFGGQSFLPGSLSKIKAIREEANRQNLPLDIEVDGGINLETAPLAVQAGANVLVTGNVLFSAPDMKARLKELREITAR